MNITFTAIFLVASICSVFSRYIPHFEVQDGVEQGPIEKRDLLAGKILDTSVLYEACPEGLHAGVGRGIRKTPTIRQVLNY